MMRSLVRVSSLLALVVLGACTPSENVTPSGSAGNAATGSAGSTGSAGTTGAAGTNGEAGTTGTAGTTGNGGSTGSAGSIAGAGGAAGTTGGSTGTAGATGGSTAGRGGTTGTAGVTGGGGAGGCTITATSTMGTIPTVGIVTFTTSASGVTGAEIRFGLTSTGPTMTAPVDLAQTNYRTLLLGMKGSSSYVYRIVANSSAGACTSQDYTIMTGAVPSSVPKPTTTISMAAAHSKGFIVTSSGISGTGAYIFDSDGAPVWWATGPSGTCRIQMSWDGSKMYMMALNVQNNNSGSVRTVNMDGSGATTVSGMMASHHDMTAIPGGFATMLWNSTGIDAPNSLIERMDNATTNTVVIANLNTVYNSNSYHTNSIHYYPSDNTYTLGDRNPNLYVKVSRTGQLIWQLGGTNPKDAAKLISGAGTWSVNHGHHLLADGTFVLFNNGSMMGGASAVRVLKLNTSNLTAMPGLTYMASGINSNVMGDAQMLPNGNILVTASQMGQITEITPGGQVVATFKGMAFGYSEYRDSLYGPPPR